MKRTTFALLAMTGLGFAAHSHAQSTTPSSTAPPISKEAYSTAKTAADLQYKVDDEACGSLSGNAKDICMAHAKGKHNVATADAEAAYKNTPANREASRVARVDANYDIAMQRCDDLAGNGKDVCEKEAKASSVAGTADAKVDRVTADTRIDAADKQAEVRSEANADKTSADYDVAIEKCDVLAGQAKDECVGSAKMKFGKS